MKAFMGYEPSDNYLRYVYPDRDYIQDRESV